MTEYDDDPIHPLDETASAALDDEPGPGGIGPADAELLTERMTELGRVRDLVAAPIDPPSPATRDAMISAAIAAGAETPTTSLTEPVTSLEEARRARAGRIHRLAPLAVAAALLLVGAIVIPAMLNRDDDVTIASSPIEGSADTSATDADSVPPSPTDMAAMNESSAGADLSDDGDLEQSGIAVAGDAAESGSGVAGSEPELAAPSAESTVTDQDLLDIVAREEVRARSLDAVPFDQQACAEEVGHRIDRTFRASYGSEAAVYFVEMDGTDATAVTVVNHNCQILAETTGG